MRKNAKKLLIMLLVMVMAFGTMTISASAKTKSLKMKYCGFETRTSAANKKATAVKTGSYVVTIPAKRSGYLTKRSGYLKFTAPKAKSYTFTTSGVKSNSGSGSGIGYFYIMTKYGEKNQYISMANVKTEGGKTDTLRIAAKSQTSGAKKNRYLSSRSGTIKLKKGETVYLYYYFSNGNSFNLKIK